MNFKIYPGGLMLEKIKKQILEARKAKDSVKGKCS